jgi:hypothetical protein
MLGVAVEKQFIAQWMAAAKVQWFYFSFAPMSRSGNTWLTSCIYPNSGLVYNLLDFAILGVVRSCGIFSASWYNAGSRTHTPSESRSPFPGFGKYYFIFAIHHGTRLTIHPHFSLSSYTSEQVVFQGQWGDGNRGTSLAGRAIHLNLHTTAFVVRRAKIRYH